MIKKSISKIKDVDPVETQEWLESLESMLQYEGRDRSSFVLSRLLEQAKKKNIPLPSESVTPYLNSIPADEETPLPKDARWMKPLTNYMRWNALAMVLRVTHQQEGLGGHLASYASIATLFEVGFNYFFHAKDLVFFQGHSAEGVYARAFLEGRITVDELIHFRQEALTKGLSSYPHPHLMPHFWQFPTVSMGLGPLMAIYQAQLLKYLDNRGLSETQQRKVWAFCGDGETGEPETLGALLVATRERLDNLIFVINCNLQRLDGPVSGNGQIIQELEGLYRGAGWRVIKVIWGSQWDRLFEKDDQGLLLERISQLVDGEYQLFTARDGAYMREHFFGTSKELAELVSDMSDADLKGLLDGGHDPQKVYAAYAEAVKDSDGRPTVVLAKTVKGFGFGIDGEAQNITHNLDEISQDGIKRFCERFDLPLNADQQKKLEFIRFEEESPEFKYLKERREALGGPLPHRVVEPKSLTVTPLTAFEPVLNGSGERAISTSAAFSRIMMILLKDQNITQHIVPIVADEARTLGLEGLFRQTGIYALKGQQYEPEDQGKLIVYREDPKGQLLQQGISEAGAISSWIAAATSYANNGVPLIPFYAYYAMYGYQRVGDLVWAAGDMQARGFLLGGLAGRTTLAGEGLQHQDSHNFLMFSMVPCCRTYDPTFGYELAVIIQDGLKRMYVDQENVFYYITMMNEAYTHPPMPKGVEADIIKGLYLFQASQKKAKCRVQLLGAGAILREVIKAGDYLEQHYNIAADIWSVPSFNLLRSDIESTVRYNRLHPNEAKKESHVSACLNQREGPVIAATDYMKLVAEQIRQSVKAPYYVLGTDGFGRSDTRSALRDFFEVDAKMIVYTALSALTDQGQFNKKDLIKSMESLGIDPKRPDPWTV